MNIQLFFCLNVSFDGGFFEKPPSMIWYAQRVWVRVDDISCPHSNKGTPLLYTFIPIFHINFSNSTPSHPLCGGGKNFSPSLFFPCWQFHPPFSAESPEKEPRRQTKDLFPLHFFYFIQYYWKIHFESIQMCFFYCKEDIFQNKIR